MGGQMARRWAAAAVTCLATAVLAGCSGGRKQASTTLPTTSAPVTTAASPTLPPLGPPDFPVPAEARAKTPEGVTAFTRYYVALIDHQLKSLDPSPLNALSSHCDTCDQLAHGYDQTKAAGQTIQGGELSVISTGTATVEGDAAEISTYLSQTASSVTDNGGRLVPKKSKAAVQLGGGMKFAWDTARLGWVVTQFDADPL